MVAAGIKAVLKVKDTGELARVLKTLRDADRAAVHVGVLAVNEDVALRATVNEFGSPEKNIPERSFLRKTFDEKRTPLRDVQKRALSRVIAGKITVEEGLSIIGQWFQREVQRTITDTYSPPNAPSTIAKKGSSHPLIDTGEMRQAIAYEVNLKGGPARGIQVIGSGEVTP